MVALRTSGVLLLVCMIFRLALAQAPTTQPIAIDQATIDRAMERLKERRGTVSPTSRPVVRGINMRPDDVDADTWREFHAYLERERPAVRWAITYATKENSELKKMLVRLKAKRKPEQSDLDAIESYRAQVEQNEQRIQDLRAGRPVPHFHGPNLDLERPRLDQIGYIGTGGMGNLALVYMNEERDGEGRSVVSLQWQRWGERTQKTDRIITDRYRLYIKGRPTDVTTETHDVDPGAIDMTDTVLSKTVNLIVRDPTFRHDAYPSPGLRRGMDVSINHAYRVTKIDGGQVELTVVDIAKLKNQLLAARVATTQPAVMEDR
jgi:hypothetical protein